MAGRKPTAAMPKPETHGFRCWSCPLGPDLQPELISGYATPAEALRAFLRHQTFAHPAPGGVRWRSVGK